MAHWRGGVVRAGDGEHLQAPLLHERHRREQHVEQERNPSTDHVLLRRRAAEQDAAETVLRRLLEKKS